MSELKPCPFCGGKVEPEDMGEAIVICCPCDLTPCAARATTEAVTESWSARALAPALDVVIAEVEAQTSESHGFSPWIITLQTLRALREAQSATDSPSGPAAQSDTGEQEGG